MGRVIRSSSENRRHHSKKVIGIEQYSALEFKFEPCYKGSPSRMVFKRVLTQTGHSVGKRIRKWMSCFPVSTTNPKCRGVQTMELVSSALEESSTTLTCQPIRRLDSKLWESRTRTTNRPNGQPRNMAFQECTQRSVSC